MSGTVTDALAHWARERPEHIAIDFAGEVIGYRELNDWADRVALDLRTRGVAPGDRVSVLGVNSLEWCAAALGAWRAGAIVAPFNQRMLAGELAGLVAACEPRVIYCDADLESRLPADAAFSVARFERDVAPLRGVPGGSVKLAGDGPDEAAIVFTSGTTGKPKGVVFTHSRMAALFHDWSLVESVPPNGLRVLMVLPLFSAAGVIWGIARTVLNGGTMLLQPGFDPAAALRVLVRDRVNTFTGPPILWERIAALPEFAGAELAHLTTAHVGGARVPPELLRRWAPRGVVLRQLYGQTEIGGSVTVTPPRAALAKPETCGSGTVFSTIRVVDPDGVDCAPGAPGEILLRGPGMMAGYWRDPEATAATIVDGWLRTGDLGTLDAEGDLTFVDRLKDLIISGGLNIAPAEVEAVVQTMPGVEEVAVISVPDEKFGETPAALVRAAAAITERDIVEYCAARLADYKVPRYVVLCAEPLPRMASGKIAKRELREAYTDVPERFSRVR
ncbi:class I adenylate-forming enzyme family protein [Nocardia sp. NPDC057227]|uniref:class I adenylate-forming enzyme family protein n=1 Tax=Nocardia sp. NPDC057227 TaxID=3346056 RepID=UPI0036293CA3